MLDFCAALLVSFWFLPSVLRLCFGFSRSRFGSHVVQKPWKLWSSTQRIIENPSMINHTWSQNELKINISLGPSRRLLGNPWRLFWPQNGPKLRKHRKVTWGTSPREPNREPKFFWWFWFEACLFMHFKPLQVPKLKRCSTDSEYCK